MKITQKMKNSSLMFKDLSQEYWQYSSEACQVASGSGLIPCNIGKRNY